PESGQARSEVSLHPGSFQDAEVVAHQQGPGVHAVESRVHAVESLRRLGPEGGELCFDVVQALAGLGEAVAELLAGRLLLGFEAGDALAFGTVGVGELLRDSG